MFETAQTTDCESVPGHFSERLLVTVNEKKRKQKLAAAADQALVG